MGSLDMEFDAYLSYNRSDAPLVRLLAERLTAKGLRCWIDEDQLRPGQDWHEGLERGMQLCRTILFCLGADGVSIQQSEEAQTAVRPATRNEPWIMSLLLLPGAPPDMKQLPSILRNRNIVDLRNGFDGPELDQLAQYLTDRRPESTEDSPAPAIPLADLVDLAYLMTLDGALSPQALPSFNRDSVEKALESAGIRDESQAQKASEDLKKRFGNPTPPSLWLAWIEQTSAEAP